jgi:hypothetical protein
MKKGAFIFILSLFFINCQEKTEEVQKTYEELEAEVLCGVLPQIAHEFVMTTLPPPPPPEKDYEKYNYRPLSTEDFIKFVENQKDSIKILANEKNKYRIGIIDTLRGIDFTYYKKGFPKHLNDFIPTFDSLDYRKIYKNEVKKSTLLINLYGSEFLPHFANNHNHDEHTIISISRVVINKNKDKAFFDVLTAGCVPFVFKIISTKNKNKWVVKGIVK